MDAFDYSTAFSRNLGWVTEAEQARLRNARVAIAGLGGVGGVHALTLARLGVGKFSIADFDTFDWANFNRQAGAFVSTVGVPKIEVIARTLRDINPEVEIRAFPEGVTAGNVAAFLEGADSYVDGLDFFAFQPRRLVFGHCHAHGIPATTVAPLAMGAALLNFLPGRMSFERYFDLRDEDDEDVLALKFLVGLSPAMLQRSYLVDDSRVDLRGRRGPSTGMACQLCAGVAVTEVLKILLRRGPVYSAPWVLHFDAYRCKYAKSWRPGGNRNPLQRLLMGVIRRRLRM
jgi:molybdopterin/thiamine biosynthesis adenylyltransferase